MCRIFTLTGKHGSLKPKNLSLEDDILVRGSFFSLGFGLSQVASLGFIQTYLVPYPIPPIHCDMQLTQPSKSVRSGGHVARREAETESSVRGGAVRGQPVGHLGEVWEVCGVVLFIIYI